MARLFVERDPRGALVHIKREDTKECMGCIESGLFALVERVVREQVLHEVADAAERHALGGKERER